MRNKWTKEELDFINKNYMNLSDLEISNELCSHSEKSVTTKRKRMGLIKSNRKYTFKDVVEEFNKTEYILLSDKSEYIDAASKSLRYLCPKHMDKGEQIISLGHLQSGRGCYYCGRETTENARLIDNNVNEKECKELCLEKGFEYVGTDRENGFLMIKYICKKHLELGIQKMRKGNMKRNNIQGCPYCFDTKKFKFSYGEKKVEEILQILNIKYIPQYSFNDCKDKTYLPFDFYLYELNKCIEYDGQHYFFPVNFNGISDEEANINYKNTLKHDKIKNEYCINNNIELLRISYYDFKNISEIINNFIKNSVI